MTDKTPAGLSISLWAAITQGLEQSPSTINDYRKILNLLYAYSGGKYSVHNITSEDAQRYFDFIESRAREGKLSVNTVHRYKATLRSIGARLERSGALKDYVSPFHGLVRHEQRSRTVYTESTFADPKKILTLRRSMNQLDTQDRILIELMLSTGLSPVQITELKVSDFRMENSRLVLMSTAKFLEESTAPWQESPLFKAGMPISFVRASRTNITWNYTGTYVFAGDFAKLLLTKIPTLGTNRDERRFFHTARHLDFTYRAIHHLLGSACESCGLSRKDITPNQVSLFGTALSALQSQGAQLPFKPIGCWKDRLPIPQQKQADAIMAQLGPQALHLIAGI